MTNFSPNQIKPNETAMLAAMAIAAGVLLSLVTIFERIKSMSDLHSEFANLRPYLSKVSR